MAAVSFTQPRQRLLDAGSNLGAGTFSLGSLPSLTGNGDDAASSSTTTTAEQPMPVDPELRRQPRPSRGHDEESYDHMSRYSGGTKKAKAPVLVDTSDMRILADQSKLKGASYGDEDDYDDDDDEDPEDEDESDGLEDPKTYNRRMRELKNDDDSYRSRHRTSSSRNNNLQQTTRASDRANNADLFGDGLNDGGDADDAAAGSMESLISMGGGSGTMDGSPLAPIAPPSTTTSGFSAWNPMRLVMSDKIGFGITKEEMSEAMVCARIRRVRLRQKNPIPEKELQAMSEREKHKLLAELEYGSRLEAWLALSKRLMLWGAERLESTDTTGNARGFTRNMAVQQDMYESPLIDIFDEHMLLNRMNPIVELSMSVVTAFEAHKIHHKIAEDTRTAAAQAAAQARHTDGSASLLEALKSQQDQRQKQQSQQQPHAIVSPRARRDRSVSPYQPVSPPSPPTPRIRRSYVEG
jgi:hypothetical protein